MLHTPCQSHCRKRTKPSRKAREGAASPRRADPKTVTHLSLEPEYHLSDKARAFVRNNIAALVHEKGIVVAYPTGDYPDAFRAVMKLTGFSYLEVIGVIDQEAAKIAPVKPVKARLPNPSKIRRLLNEILSHQIANRGQPNAFYRCYTYPGGEMPAWVAKAEALLAQLV